MSATSTSPTYQFIQIERRDAVTVLFVNRPSVMNAINRATLGEIADAVRAFVADPAQGALIVTGRGEKAFISGADAQIDACITREPEQRPAVARHHHGPLGEMLARSGMQ